MCEEALAGHHRLKQCNDNAGVSALLQDKFASYRKLSRRKFAQNGLASEQPRYRAAEHRAAEHRALAVVDGDRAPVEVVNARDFEGVGVHGNSAALWQHEHGQVNHVAITGVHSTCGGSAGSTVQ